MWSSPVRPVERCTKWGRTLSGPYLRDCRAVVGASCRDPAAALIRSLLVPEGRPGLHVVDQKLAGAEGLAPVAAGDRHQHDGVLGLQTRRPGALCGCPAGPSGRGEASSALIERYTYTEGGVAADPTVPLTNAHVEVNGAMLAYAPSLEVLGKSAKFDFVLPCAWLSGSAEFAGQPHQREISGLADPRFHLSVNFYGAPRASMASPITTGSRTREPA
jgi:hypothetical protein